MQNILEKETFDGTINISSNIKENKRTIIGKFDLRDLLFIFVAGIVGVVVLAIAVGIFLIRNILIILFILAIFEVPIISLGFMNIYNMRILDYLKLKEKQDNKVYRSQIKSKKHKDNDNKYIFSISFTIDKDNIFKNIENIDSYINNIEKFIYIKDIQVKLMYGNIYISLLVDTEYKEVDYKGLLNYISENKFIKYVSYEDMKAYEDYIKALFILDKKYTKEQLKNIEKIKNRLKNIKILDIDYNKKYSYLKNDVIKGLFTNNTIKVYKTTIYKKPYNIELLFRLLEICNMTIYIENNINSLDKETPVFSLRDANIVNSYYEVIGNIGTVRGNTQKLTKVLYENHILIKDIDEEKVKETLLFYMDNRY